MPLISLRTFRAEPPSAGYSCCNNQSLSTFFNFQRNQLEQPRRTASSKGPGDAVPCCCIYCCGSASPVLQSDAFECANGCKGSIETARWRDDARSMSYGVWTGLHSIGGAGLPGFHRRAHFCYYRHSEVCECNVAMHCKICDLSHTHSFVIANFRSLGWAEVI